MSYAFSSNWELQICINPFCTKLFVCPLLYDIAIFHHQNQIRISYRRESMRNDSKAGYPSTHRVSMPSWIRTSVRYLPKRLPHRNQNRVIHPRIARAIMAETLIQSISILVCSIWQPPGSVWIKWWAYCVRASIFLIMASKHAYRMYKVDP